MGTVKTIRSHSAPHSISQGDIWIDLNYSPPRRKVFTASGWKVIENNTGPGGGPVY